ncbi:GMC family oxidoreductase [Paraburkholderia phenoliruptrix]|uniref:GMC family oxidoreductase n=1 Tax=Paraburkholderia phenoliruptrix TaxID=252970 RepID=UPI001C6E71C0|nr:GMC family oxidoreductase N-terminal domain-containing protein [Paraburkholderia phenoliruptrix]MBW9105323.1 GMC family oxidoreductase N-terminal domain-containing protein [Paraburkholderia phenoliruptrix]MBW9129968.1 GMC family oxidoreductase N-terminal domain-containing protein [Paraburkholderia ginsengiterrae]
MERFDYVIVGGGSAGCVLAHRLSAVASLRVALIEAGADTPPGAVPAAILDSYPMPVFCGETYIWPDLKAKATRHAAPRVYEQGRVMGGGSSINVQSANRGLPRDYDEWAANGAHGWAWRDVLPYFRKLERDVDFPGGELHGSDGPVPIRRIMPNDWPPFCHAFAKGLRANGLAQLQDQNGEFGDGFFPGAFSNIDDKRVSTAIAYLDEATRKRPNLTVYSKLRVERIVMEGGAARGVVAVTAGGERVRFEAGEVVLSAGALQSPALLMRAGIGDACELQALGIACAVERPGVGRNLQDHPALTFCHFLEPRFRMPLTRRRASMMAARMSSGVAGCDESDLYLSSATRAAWHALGNRLGLFFLWCNRPHSRGRVQLLSADSDAAPRVDLNLLDDERDLQRLTTGVRMLARVVQASGLGRDSRDFFPAAFSPRVKALSQVSERNARLTAVLGTLLDTPAPLRRFMLERFFTRGLNVAALVADDRALAEFIRANVFGVWHASGTCRMGDVRDRDAVTDAEGRVHGAKGLRVVDASLMPRLPSANTNIPTIMIAEKIADAMIAARRASAASGTWSADGAPSASGPSPLAAAH